MADAAQVWVVDDDRSVRFVLAAALGEAGFRVTAFADAGEVLAALAAGRAPDLLLTDVRMPGDSGLVLLDRLKEALPRLPVIVMSAHTDVASTAGAFRGGAQEFLSKPFDLDAAVALVHRTLPARHAMPVAAPAAAPPEPLPALVGQAPAMRELFRAIGRLAQVPLSVLITGETGTGKELVARALHRESPRAARPFVALNTAAIPPSCWNPNCSATRPVPSPARPSASSGASNKPTAAPCSSTRSATCPRRCKPGCCGCWPKANSSASAGAS